MKSSWPLLAVPSTATSSEAPASAKSSIRHDVSSSIVASSDAVICHAVEKLPISKCQAASSALASSAASAIAVAAVATQVSSFATSRMSIDR
jgi:hypothetical protein